MIFYSVRLIHLEVGFGLFVAGKKPYVITKNFFIVKTQNMAKNNDILM
jgi:hypothetical protein